MTSAPSAAAFALHRWALIVSLFALVGSSNGGAAERVDFNFQVRPILSDRCFKCHGPDEKSRKANLRLDNPDGAYATIDKKDKRRAIVPRKPQLSEVVRRITSNDPNEVMPPPESKLQLSTNEINILRQWIAEGAEYKSHWAFLPVRKSAPPKLSRDTWSRNAIDRFVLQRLQREGLKPSDEASRETLIRRLSLDLRGIPPSPDEVSRFRDDPASNAFEKVVDAFLAAPAYGERMANDWLDLARYADTYGYQSDVDRDMFPWRDWVIRAFNQNLSYDQFITWQIAGDLLQNATDEQILATAFNRLHRQTNEGGSIEEEFRNEYVSDRVHTFGTAILGLTLECCRCHDHKYDPIKQKDYYRLSAFFNNIDESGLYSHFTQATPTPTLLLYKDGEKQKHAVIEEKIKGLDVKLSAIEKTSSKQFDEWLQKASSDRSVVDTDIKSGMPSAIRFSFEQVDGNKTRNENGKSEGVLNESPKLVDGRFGKALQFNGENSVVVSGVGDFKRVDPFSFALWLRPTERQERAVVFHHSRAWTDSGSRGYELVLEKGKANFALIHFWPGNAISIRTRDEIPTNQWTHLTITYDGSSRASGLRIFVNGKLADTEVVRDNLYKDITHRAEWGDADAGGIQLTLAARFRDSGFKGGLIDEFTVFDQALTAAEVATLNAVAPSKPDLFGHFLSRVQPEYRGTIEELHKLRQEENKFINDVREIMVMHELSWRRPTYVLKRGAYDARGEQVEPGVPETIFPFAKDLPRNRLGLARWLVDERNPLTARVIVNRIWKMHFGRGLVATAEDFGSQGQLPTHPELLDWLAKNFVDSGWDVKALHKLIVTSATYRQSSVASTQLQAADPENRLLARGPKHRLQAEQIRDSALTVSGLLSAKVGGPSVKPYQPAGLWENSGLSKTYVQDHGDSLYRRSLYTFWRRTAPPPSMMTFDATAREVCTAKRETTVTPLQALVLLNDPQFIEAARVLAEKSLEATPDVDAAIADTFQHVLGRTAQPRELKVLRQLFDEQLAIFKGNASAAEKVLKIGERVPSAKQPVDVLASMTMVANTLMNHDEFVMKR